METDESILVVGGGPAGMMAALTAAQQGADVTLAERNDRLGRKLLLTGGGRCNLTHLGSAEKILKQVVHNGKFLYSAMVRFSPDWVMEFFEQLGLSLKIEPDGRVFPASDRAGDVRDALEQALQRANVRRISAAVTGLDCASGQVTGVRTEQGILPARAVILATGGMTYPDTGSRGDGQYMARQAGHTITPMRGGLTGLCTDSPLCPTLQGVALPDAGIRILDSSGRTVVQDRGELLFTHFGVSGPVILNASSRLEFREGDSLFLNLDFLPDLEAPGLRQRMLELMTEHSNREVVRVLQMLLPKSVAAELAVLAGLEPGQKVHSLTRIKRRTREDYIKPCGLTLVSPLPVEQAKVTVGGVSVSEVHPKTMESKLVRGLFFAGELLDVDALTGGYNLQIAWATGRAAGAGAAEQVLSE